MKRLKQGIIAGVIFFIIITLPILLQGDPITWIRNIISSITFGLFFSCIDTIIGPILLFVSAASVIIMAVVKPAETISRMIIPLGFSVLAIIAGIILLSRRKKRLSGSPTTPLTK